jgi:isopentenyl diphosphate isomerase/L-lactate dehydrogenase-like FMN-dependent dehydrogenase
MVDGRVRSGINVRKMLALGAEIVLLGSPVIVGAAGGGPEGVKMFRDKLISGRFLCY